MINVTKTYLPPLEEYLPYLEKIWEFNQVTNNGKLSISLEQKLKEYLGVKHLIYLNNGTLALQLAIKALGLKGKVITTPFSYVATTSALVWEHCQPLFADINPDTYCIDPHKIEALIDEDTVAIMPTHVFGNICEVEAIEQIADKHNLKVIYDAAHTFGANYKGKSLASYGDCSILSFHATKLFHTIEGGAVATNNDEIAHTVEYMRRFGHKDQINFHGLGINAKNSEVHAAIGLALLPKVSGFIQQRKQVCSWYDELLSGLPITKQAKLDGLDYNYAYYPVVFESENKVLEIKETLAEKEIYPRRYFYPSLNTLSYVEYMPCPVSEDLVKRILCLPLYPDLRRDEVELICSIIKTQF